MQSCIDVVEALQLRNAGGLLDFPACATIDRFNRTGQAAERRHILSIGSGTSNVNGIGYPAKCAPDYLDVMGRIVVKANPEFQISFFPYSCFILLRMAYCEADTHAKLIDPAIHALDWAEELIRREATRHYYQDATKVLGKPADILREMKGRMFAA